MILKIISEGYRIPFYNKPPLHMPHTGKDIKTPFSKDMEVQIQAMKKMGVLESAQLSPSFLSSLFLNQKEDGSFRPIFNLRRLNLHVHLTKFRLINQEKVPSFLQPKDWLAKIDLSNAYFHLSIAPSHRRYLRLIFGGELLQMTCLPFGLASAPKIFASLTNWVAQILRERGVRTLVYLDDFLLAHQNKETLRSQVEYTVQLLESLGWQINYKKCVLIPQKEIQYLGITWDPHLNYKKLPIQKQNSLKEKILRLLNKGNANLKETQSLIGSLNFASIVVPYGRLHFRKLLELSNRLLESDPLTVSPLPKAVNSELVWWLANYQKSSLIHQPMVSHYISTDASGSGWGAQLDNAKLSGSWTPQEQTLHSNHKEMLAILKTIQGHTRLLSNSSISIQSDNKTVLSYLRNEGGTKSRSLMELTYQVFHLIQEHNLYISLHHLPGRYNVEADHLSRGSHHPEWHLLPTLTKTVFAKFGVPQIDLFASHRAHVVPNYVSLDAMDNRAVYTDAFSQIWKYKLAWVFPPPFLMPKVLTHLNTATGTYLVIAPRWEKAFWRPDLKRRATAAPFTVRNLADVLIDTVSNKAPAKIHELTIEIWRCGGGTSHLQTGLKNR